jgi:hypothetical protein
MPTMVGLREGHDQPQGLLAEGIDHVYVHEGALGRWAVTSTEHATEMFMFLATVKFRQAIGQTLNPYGDLEHEAAAWEGDEAAREAAANILRGPDESRFIDPLLKHAAFSVISMDTESDPATGSPILERLVPIGGPLVGSCFEQDYHTYAFTQEGDFKMRVETGPISELAAAMGVGTGPKDLAVAHGPNGSIMREGLGLLSFNATVISQGGRTYSDDLVPVELGTGPEGSKAYVREETPDIQLPLDEVLGLDKAMRNGIVQTANVRIEMVKRDLDKQRHDLGAVRYKARVEHLEYLGGEVGRILGRHRLIRQEFYPQAS